MATEGNSHLKKQVKHDYSLKGAYAIICGGFNITVNRDYLHAQNQGMKNPDSDIDGGRAWVVLFTVYIGIVIVSTSLYMTGVLYVVLLEHYQADETMTSLVGALNGGLLCLLGPFASVVMVTFSCRVCMFAGAAISAVSCVASAYTEDIYSLIITFGIFGGIGNALSCTTFVVVLGYYFEKRRNIVIAISQAALGVGFFLASPVTLACLKAYGLHGFFVILGSAYAQICVIAMLCKPSSIEKRIMSRHKPEYELEIVSIEEVHPTNDTKQHLLEPDKKDSMENISKLLMKNRISEQINGLKPPIHCNGNAYHGSVEIVYEMNGQASVVKSSINKPNGLQCNVRQNVTSSCIDIQRAGKSYGAIDSRVFWSNGHLSNIAASNGFLHELFSIPNDESKYTQVPGRPLWISRLVNGLCNIHLFQNPSFMLFLLSTMTWNFTLSMCAMHLPNYMVIKGSSDFEVAAIMTCLSFSNFLGRFIGALTVEKGGLDSLTLHVGMLGIAGVVTLLFPIYAGHAGVYFFAAAVGLYTGGPNSIMTPISLQMVGMEHLSSAHGLERFFCGLGYFAGPPIAGYLYSVSGSYESSFLCAGAVILVGSVVAMASSINHRQTDTGATEDYNMEPET